MENIANLAPTAIAMIVSLVTVAVGYFGLRNKANTSFVVSVADRLKTVEGHLAECENARTQWQQERVELTGKILTAMTDSIAMAQKLSLLEKQMGQLHVEQFQLKVKSDLEN